MVAPVPSSGTPPLSIGSTHWWRVASLKPRLRGHLHIHRHAYRGQPWYVVEDRVAGKYYRFNLAVYRLIDRFDGRRSLQQIWEAALREGGAAMPTQDEIVHVLGQLYQADLLQAEVTPDTAELLQRRGKASRRQWMSRYLNPVALRWRLVDPDRALVAVVRAAGPLLGWPLALAWFALVLPALLLVPSHWPELTQNFGEQLLAADNLLVMALLFPLLKALHELAHGLAVRRLGGEVHEMGLMFLVFFPVPYVDASAAAAFPRRRDRVLVGAAGMLAELAVAALAFYAWLLLEPGLVRSLAYNLVVLGGVTTLFFNANPLLRFDGYYMLIDTIEVPNLGQRANQHWLRAIERRVFGVAGAAQGPPPPSLPGERGWFWFYAPAALVYRLSVSLGIALFIAAQYFFVGVVVAVWTLALSIAWPLVKGAHAVWTQSRFARRGWLTLVAGTLALLALLFGLPLPHHTVTEGVVGLPEDAIVRAGGNGFVHELLVQPGAAVVPGQPLARLVNPELAAKLSVQRAKLDAAQARLDAAWGVQPARAAQLAHTLAQEVAALRRLEDDAARLTLTAAAPGTLVAQAWRDLNQRYLRRGEVLGHLMGPSRPLLRVVVPQADVDAVRLATRAVELRLPQEVARVWPAQFVRQVPMAVHELPSPVLGSQGGGTIALDPRDPQGLKAIESQFEFELKAADELPLGWIGSRVHVRFKHPAEPLGPRALRALRRLFLTQFTL